MEQRSRSGLWQLFCFASNKEELLGVGVRSLIMPSSLVFFGGCVALFSACLIASAGGVGGGGLSVPILLLIFGYSFETAVPLSQFVVLGNALSQCLVNIQHRNPYRHRKPLIWWELVIVLSPAQLGGSNLGNLLAKIFPDSVMYILALVMLLYATKLSISKGLHRRQEEQMTVKHKDPFPPPTSPMTPTKNPMIVDNAVLETSLRKKTEEEEERLSITEDGQHAIQWPRLVLSVILIVWLGYLGLSLGRAQTDTCSDAYIILFVLSYLPLVIGCFWGVWYNRREQEERKELFDSSSNRERESALVVSPTPLDEVEESLFTHHLFVLPPMVFGIGIICSLLGIGGGELLSPMMLVYHVPPVITSATSASLSLLNTSSIVIRSISVQEVNLTTGSLLFVTGLMGGLIGRKFGLYVATQLNQASTIIFALAAALFLSAIYYLFKLASGDFDSSLSNPCTS